MHQEICPWGEGPDTISFSPHSFIQDLQQSKARSKTMSTKEKVHQRPSTAGNPRNSFKEKLVGRPSSCRKNSRIIEKEQNFSVQKVKVLSIQQFTSPEIQKNYRHTCKIETLKKKPLKNPFPLFSNYKKFSEGKVHKQEHSKVFIYSPCGKDFNVSPQEINRENDPPKYFPKKEKQNKQFVLNKKLRTSLKMQTIASFQLKMSRENKRIVRHSQSGSNLVYFNGTFLEDSFPYK